ncbi:g3597 [Coccomyxa elongata]
MQDDFEEDSFLETYRQIRLAQLKEAANRRRYGTVSSIQRADFVREVTEASRECWVIVLLNQDKILGCQVLLHCLVQLAQQYQHLKFISMLSTDCIPDYPNENLPMLLVYKDGQCKRTIVGLRSLGVDRISPESVAAGLNEVGPICTEANMAA